MPEESRWYLIVAFFRRQLEHELTYALTDAGPKYRVAKLSQCQNESHCHDADAKTFREFFCILERRAFHHQRVLNRCHRFYTCPQFVL
jgi:hypothetical protein